MTALKQVLNYLKEYAGIIGVIISFAAVWATYSYALPRRSISYDIESITPLLNPEAKQTTNLKVSFLGKDMPKIHLGEITISNNGNREILPAEYFEPISICVGEKTEILSADFSDSKPAGLMGDLSPLISKDRAHVMIPKVLLNQGDSFRLKLLTSRRPKFTIISRIQGISEITKPNYYIMFAIGTVFILLTIFYFFWAIYQIGNKLKKYNAEIRTLKKQLLSGNEEDAVSSKPNIKISILVALFIMGMYGAGVFMTSTAINKLKNRGLTEEQIWYSPPENQE